jgi:hypothetical protein
MGMKTKITMQKRDFFEKNQKTRIKVSILIVLHQKMRILASDLFGDIELVTIAISAIKVL